MSDTLTCPACGSDAIATRSETEDFIFRSGGVEYPVHATYPVYVCERCNESFAGEAAEEARHAATCAALNRLTPADIRALRERLGLSRKTFAQLSGLGEASLARWETGELIQSESNDNLLRLLQLPENVRLLQRTRTGKSNENSSTNPAAVSSIVVHALRRQTSNVAMISTPRNYAGLNATDIERERQKAGHFKLKGMSALH